MLVWEPGTQHTGTVSRMRSQDIIIIIPELIFGLQVPGIVSLILILGSCLLILATLPLSLIAVIKVVQVSLLLAPVSSEMNLPWPWLGGCWPPFSSQTELSQQSSSTSMQSISWYKAWKEKSRLTQCDGNTGRSGNTHSHNKLKIK